MREMIKSKLNTMKNVALVSGAAVLASAGAFATPLIANDTLDGLSDIGTELSDFLGNLAPGLFKFILLIGIGVAIVALITAIISYIKGKAGKAVR